MKGVRTHDFSGDMHDCTGSCKSNYHTITTTMTSHVYLRERERERGRERERESKIKNNIYHTDGVPKCSWEIVEPDTM